MNKKTLFHLSIFTLFGFSLIAYLLLYFHTSISFFEVMQSNNLPFSLGTGLGLGTCAALLGILLLKVGPFETVNDFFSQMILQLNPRWYHILFYSFCAGVGEEILFRGAIQSYLAIWPTAIIFVLIHGYIHPKNWRLSIYGIFLVFISGGFGYLMKMIDIYSAISAHFIYDIIMFSYLKYTANRQIS